MTPRVPDAGLSKTVVEHHLRLFGFDGGTGEATADRPERARIVIAPSVADHDELAAFAAEGGVAVAVMPDNGFCRAAGVGIDGATLSPPAVCGFRMDKAVPWGRLRSLHPVKTFSGENLRPLVVTEAGGVAWAWKPVGVGGICFLGTDLGADLIRYRQGDQEDLEARKAAAHRDAVARYGFAGERPNYLFEGQRRGEEPAVRHADNWVMALATVLSNLTDTPLRPVLPGAAAGAVVVTGDDDAAYLEAYSEQRRVLGDTPVTYFLHPDTRHDRESLDRMRRDYPTDFGIHPDALEAPDRYGEIFREQLSWYIELMGEPPLSVRNHGVLNDGYWGHVPAWREAGVRMSLNVSGFDGVVLNGSLLPARLAIEGGLTEHWTMLTAIGDGIMFAGDYDDEKSRQCVSRVAQAIKSSGIPGVMVLNLHPQNIETTRSMHEAVLDLADDGFLAWTVGEFLEWFSERDGQGFPAGRGRATP